MSAPAPSIRPVRPAEAAAVRDLLHAAHAWNLANGFNFTAADITLEDLVPRLDPARFHVAEGADGALLGTVEIKPEGPKDPWHRPGDWGLHLLAVAPAAAGLGLGRALVAHAEGVARAAGAPRLVLDTPANHPWLPALYRRLGYQDLAVTRWDGKWYDSVILVKAFPR